MICAAAYARMSTEHQAYSIQNQLSAIQEYADQHAMTLVRTYADEGKSGLELKGRPALTQLLSDVQSGHADFQVILVYDVSRWGRFQDTDESAYYEFACRRAKLGVVYCAEPFDNDGSALAAILKNIKRVMAAEYSREQSNRVLRAAKRVASMGFHAGGSVPYGYRRMLVGEDQTHRFILEPGTRKALSRERVVLTPGPPAERGTVRRIFRLYANHHLTPFAIADRLNAEGKRNQFGRNWHGSSIVSLLRNEAYLGTLIYNRIRSILKAPRRRNDPEAWVRVEGAFDPIVSSELFAAAQGERVARAQREHSDEELLDRLRGLLAREGHLSSEIILADTEGPHISIYRRRFKGLRGAYARIGFTKLRNNVNLDLERRVLHFGHVVKAELRAAIRARGGTATRAPYRGGLFTINGKFKISVGIAKYMPTPAQHRPRWLINTRRKKKPRFAVIARLDERNERVLDYFLLPQAALNNDQKNFSRETVRALRSYRYTSLDKLVRRVMVHARARRVGWSTARSPWHAPVPGKPRSVCDRLRPG